MEQVKETHQANPHIHLLGPRDELDFFDSQSVDIGQEITALETWKALASHRMPLLQLAFRIRDAVASKFGVKRIGGFSGEIPDEVEIGDRLDFFLVEGISPHALILTERDRHLDVMTCVSALNGVVTITSSVQCHNRFGHIYMLPVAPAHRIIVRQSLRRLQRQLRGLPAHSPVRGD